MNTSQQKHKNVFVGQMDTDSDPGYVAQGDYLDAMNIINGYGGQFGSVTTPKGTQAVTRTAASGTNTVIGAKEDKQTGNVFIFIHNSAGNHQIVLWNAKTEQAQTVAEGVVFAFDKEWKITHAEIADGKILSWTDAATWGPEHIEGNSPRKTNVIKANNTNKKATFELYAGRPGEGQFANGVNYTFRRLNNAGGIVTSVVFTADGTYLNDPAGGLSWLKTQLEASVIGTRLTITDCDGCKLEIACKFTEEYYITTSTELVMPPINRYPQTLELQHIDLIKVPPSCAPVPTYVQDPTVGTNNVVSGCFQFRTRYVFDDDEKSAWSDISYVALNTDVNGEVIKSMNAIDVDFTDVILSKASWLTMIRYVEVAVREGNTGLFRLIDRFPVCGIGVGTQRIRFFNDKLLSVVPSDDTSIASDAQVLKDYDYVPLLTGTLTMTADEQGSNRLMLGANLEGYDCPDCVSVEFSEEEDESSCLVNISGTVIIDRTFSSLADDHIPDYDHYPLGGFVIYLAGTNYYAISNNPVDGSGDGSFLIKGVPKGNYIVRVASYLCRYGNDFGARYDLNNGLEWQRTSSPVNSMDHGIETVLDLTAATGTVAFGDIHIANAHYSQLEANAFVFMEVYALDNNGLSTTVDEKLGAIGVEEMPIYWAAALPVHETTADANGFSFNHSILSGVLAPTVGATGFVELSKQSEEGWFGVETDTYQASIGPPYLCRFFLWNTDPAFSANHKRIVHGTIVDENGLPLSGVLVQLDKNGRQEMTDVNGEYSFAVFESVNPAIVYPTKHSWSGSRVDTMWTTYLSDLCYLYPPTPVSSLLTITFPGSTPFEVADIAFPLAGGLLGEHRYLKSGGIYKAGIQYEDYAGRHPGVCEVADIRVSFHTETGFFGKRRIIYEIASQPPIWATHYRIMRSKDTFYQWYLQWVSDEILYARVTSVDEPPIITSYENGDATHIFLRVNPPTDPSTAPDEVLFFFKQFTQTGFEPANGDRVRFILDEKGDLLSNDSIIESPIVGRYLDDDKYYVVIDFFEYQKKITPGWLIEFLTPRAATDKLFYSDGSCFEILNPGLANRYHAGSIQDQTASLPARGYVVGGDTYWRYQNFLYGNGNGRRIFSEHFTISDYQSSACEDIGRASAVLMDEGQRFFYNRVRYSDSYVPQSKVNGLCSFDAFSYQDINRKWGIIKWLGFNHSTLIAICEYKTQPIYVGRGRIMDLQGQTSVGRSGEILNIADETMADAGTQNPESVVLEDGRIYFWDKFQGVFWQYAQNGIVPIFGKKKNEFLQIGRTRQRITNGLDFSPAGFDRELQLYIITFGANSYVGTEGTVNIPASTIAYSPDKQGWVTRFSFVPEWYGRVGTNLLSFLSGAMWVHNRVGNDNFYGTQYTSWIKFAVNPAMSTMKDFYSMRILSKLKWFVPLLEALPSFSFPGGMKSRMLATRWKSEENQWYSDILRDYTDNAAKFVAITNPVLRLQTALLQGRIIKGEVILVTIETEDGSQPQILKDTTVSFLPSLNTE